jgi:hypothetical protein
MQIYENVHGSEESSRLVIVGKTTVYIHSNVREEIITDEITGETRTEYIYDEVQYTRQEWEQILSESQGQMEDALCGVDTEIEDIKEALCDLDERLEGGSGNE